MQYDDTKNKIKKIVGNNIRFDGHFNKCFDNLKLSQQKELFEWIINCSEYKSQPILSKKRRNIIGFVNRFGSNVRSILIKEKQGYFLVLFLDKHKYYETEMDKWGF